ncbi:LysR family transcriptional regulator substrate-binding protein [Lactobacillus intestinalis]|uniref:LysR family transcriptional regulator substrate-binding protein n=1 Tax=Lactobacillus intestinalis TaxID=151781 RepID=UPI00242BEA28|nr:LysR family transcriptional regulator substrate-binding protein [Lactobacillus intestinalis]
MTLKVGYFKSFGSKDVEKIVEEFRKMHPEIDIKLLPLYQDQVGDALTGGKIDLALTDPRDNDFNNYRLQPITEVSLMVILQAGNFMPGEQTVDIKDLKKIPNILIAKTEEEAGELHYHKDVLKITSPFIAVDSFNEAALMATSGSGYFLMNERTADLLMKDQLQKMFLLNDGQQLKQDYTLVGKKDVDYFDDFAQAAKNTLVDD